MISKFFKKWGYYIYSSLFIVLIVFIFLYPTLFMGEEAIERAELAGIDVFFTVKKEEIRDQLMAGEPISSLEETPNWNKVIYFYRSTDGAMYIQTKKRAYFLMPVKKDGEIKWRCYSSDGSMTPYGCLKDEEGKIAG